MKIASLLLIFCMALFACNSRTGNKKSKANNKDSIQQSAVSITVQSQKDKWYRRYTGTIGDRQVTVILCYYGPERDVEDGLSLISEDICEYKNGDSSTELVADSVINDSAFISEAGERQLSKWVLVLHADEATGRKTDSGATAYTNINLKEDYSNGSYPLGIIEGSDSCVYDWGNGDSSHFNVSLMVMGPSAKMDIDDAKFLNTTLLDTLSGDTLGAHNMAEYVDKLNKSYIRAYKAHIKEVQDSNDFSPMYNNEIQMFTDCVYNSNGFLEFQFNAYEYEGGAHGIFETTMACIDMNEKKSLKLADIINADDPLLDTLLKKEAMEFFQTSSEDSLKNYLLVDAVPPTDNFIISNKGLEFYYNPYEIAGFVYGPIKLFIPYSKLKGLLKDDFKKRMGLQ